VAIYSQAKLDMSLSWNVKQANGQSFKWLRSFFSLPWQKA